MDRPEHQVIRISRRRFLRLVPAVAGVTLLGRCEPGRQATPGATPVSLPLPERYLGSVGTPEVVADPTLLRFFDAHQAATVEAITARILPGTLQDPGAREAGVVVYIDQVLAYDDGFVQPAYRDGPFPQVYEGEEPPAGANEAGSEEIWISEQEIARYGYQSPLSPAEVYRLGLESLDAYARERYGADFVDLAEDQQDAIVGAMAEDEVTGFEPFSAAQFLHVLRRHTKEGMFCDPAYGGNRNMVGWRLVGYPGAQRAYTPSELQQEGTMRDPWDLEALPSFHYSRPRSPTPVAPGRGPGDGVEGQEDEHGGHGH